MARWNSPYVTPRAKLCVHTKFRPVAPFFFSGKSSFVGLFLIQKRVWPYRQLKYSPGDSDFKYVAMGLWV